MPRDIMSNFDIHKYRESSWISCINAVMSDGRPQFVNRIDHDYSDTFFQIPDSCKYICHTSKNGGLENYSLDDTCGSELTGYLYTLNLQTATYGNSSAETLINRVTRSFFDLYGFMDIDLHVLKRELKSQGELLISIAVMNRDDIIRI